SRRTAPGTAADRQRSRARRLCSAAAVAAGPGCRGSLLMRHFWVDDDLSTAEQLAILALADNLKAEPYGLRPYAGPRTVAVLFDTPQTRTRASFDTATHA